MNNDYSYEYKDDNDIYCYKGTKVLKNLLGITDVEILKNAERELSMARYYSLEKSNIEGDFSLKMLQHIHRELFQDIYEWAGEIRKVDIAKGTIFCLVPFIENQFETIHQWLSVRNYLSEQKCKEQYVRDLAYVIGEINMVHPFREGNGRAQRLYMEKLVERNGLFELHFDNSNRDEMIYASVRSSVCDYGPMQALLSKCLCQIKYDIVK